MLCTISSVFLLLIDVLCAPCLSYHTELGSVDNEGLKPYLRQQEGLQNKWFFNNTFIISSVFRISKALPFVSCVDSEIQNVAKREMKMILKLQSILKNDMEQSYCSTPLN